LLNFSGFFSNLENLTIIFKYIFLFSHHLLFHCFLRHIRASLHIPETVTPLRCVLSCLPASSTTLVISGSVPVDSSFFASFGCWLWNSTMLGGGF
jgi:hypothetical protein